MIPLKTSPTLKKDIAQLYNRINQEFYATGVKKQRIEIFEDKVIIFAQHKRVPALRALGRNHKQLTEIVDSALISEYKLIFKKEIEALTNLKVETILKDFDAETEHACTIIYFEQKLI